MDEKRVAKQSNPKELIQAARFDEAITSLHDLLASEPEQEEETEALYLLAVSQRYTGQHGNALATLECLLDKNPGYARAWQERGHVFLALNRGEDAAWAFSRAVELNPALPASLRALVNLEARAGRNKKVQQARERLDFLNRLPSELVNAIDLVHENKLYKAERLCRDFLQKHKHHIEAMRVLADIGVRLKIYDDAEFLLESCVEFAPGHLPARVDYLNILLRKTRFEKALEQAQLLLEQQPGNTRFQSSLAAALMGLGRFDEAIELYQKVLQDHPHRYELHLQTGHAQKAVGNLEQAIQSYREAYHRKPDYGDAFWSLANTKTYRFADEEIEHIRQYEKAPGISTSDRVHLCFAAGKALEDRAEYDASFEYYEKGNALKRRQTGYRIEKTLERVQAQIRTCTPRIVREATRSGTGLPGSHLYRRVAPFRFHPAGANPGVPQHGGRHHGVAQRPRPGAKTTGKKRGKNLPLSCHTA